MRGFGKTFNILSGISLLIVLLAVMIISVLPAAADPILVPLGAVSQTVQSGNVAIAVLSPSTLYSLTLNNLTVGYDDVNREASIIRFQLNADPGTRFQNSKLIFTAAYDCNGVVDSIITFDNVDNSAMPSDQSDYASRDWLSSDIVEWVSAFSWASGSQYATTDISPLLNDICARPGWQNGNYITFNILTLQQSPHPGTVNQTDPYHPIYSNLRVINKAVGSNTGAAILSYNPIMPKITTIDPLIHRSLEDNSVDYMQLQGQVDSFGAASVLYCGFEWGLSSNTYQYYSNPQAVQRSQLVPFQYTITESKYMPDQGTIYYRAIACLVPFNNSDETINNYPAPVYVASNESTLSADPSVILITAKHADIKDLQTDLGCTLKSMGAETMLNSVTINYGTTPETADGVLVVATNVTRPNSWNAVRIDHLAPNTIYYYRAHASGVAEYDGNLQQFQTYDPNKPMLVNKANTFLNKIGIGAGAWWLIIFALMLSVWLITPIREEKLGRVVGFILDLIILGAGIALVLDPWVVVLIAIVGGVALTGVILKARSN